VIRERPRSAGFSSTSTRRSASFAVMMSPASITSFFASAKCQIAGAQGVFGSFGTRPFSTSHSGAMSCFEMRS
jgi:hypothetical protein